LNPLLTFDFHSIRGLSESWSYTWTLGTWVRHIQTAVPSTEHVRNTCWMTLTTIQNYYQAFHLLIHATELRLFKWASCSWLQ
jgi:hypothetical protein